MQPLSRNHLCPNPAAYLDIDVSRNVQLPVVCVGFDSGFGSIRVARSTVVRLRGRIEMANLENSLRLGLCRASSQPNAHRMSWRRSDLLRIAATAAETGARFVRERVDVQPMAWLASPKRLLCGRTPLDACRTPEGFRRVAVLHELSLGLDAAPASVAKINLETLGGWYGTPPGIVFASRADDDFSSSLYNASIVHEDERGCFQIYAAMIARNASEVRRRLRARLGGLLENEATVRLGFDWSEPLACAMVSSAVADILMQAAEDPTSPIAIGLDFQVEQRFVC